MNRTQELITTDHAITTIKNIMKTTLSQIQLYESEVPESETIPELERAYLVLDSLLAKAKEANRILNNLDQPGEKTENDELHNEWLKGNDAKDVFNYIFNKASVARLKAEILILLPNSI